MENIRREGNRVRELRRVEGDRELRPAVQGRGEAEVRLPEVAAVADPEVDLDVVVGVVSISYPFTRSM